MARIDSERTREYRKQWAAARFAKDPEAVRAYNREKNRVYREKNREKIRATARARNASDIAAIGLTSQQRWYAKLTPAAKARQIAVRAAHREKNREKINAYNRRWWHIRHGGEERSKTVMGEILQRQLRQNDVYAAALAVVPRGVPPDVRDDIISMICMAVLEGEITLADVPKLGKTFIARHYREFDGFKTVSFDTPIGNNTTSGRPLTLHDIISTDHEVWA